MASGTSSLGRRLRKLGYGSYREYLSSDHWKSTRKRYYASRLYTGRCCGCGCHDRPLEIHHRTYKRLGAEWLMDLMALCRECHQMAHDIEGSGVQLWKATNKAMNKRRNQSRKGS